MAGSDSPHLPSDALYVAAWIRDAIIAHAQANLPFESCGLLGDPGDTPLITTMVPVQVTEPSPVRFTMEPLSQFAAHQQIEGNAGRWRAIWHSHPTTEAYPSPTDQAQVVYHDGILAVIISFAQPQVRIRAFEIAGKGKVVEYPIIWVDEALR